MARDCFVQSRFVGAKFDEHTLPLSAAKDLVTYKELVLELAKHLYLKKNSDRQRVPISFADGFHLHHQQVDGGSAMPPLYCRTSRFVVMLFHIFTAAMGFFVCSPALQGVFLHEQDALKGQDYIQRLINPVKPPFRLYRKLFDYPFGLECIRGSIIAPRLI